jgi:SAM-dependent methyltransferase
MSKKSNQDLKRQKDIGQFFTPQVVVEFIYDVLKVHLDREGKWKKGKSPSVIDPACGEGIFLKVALDKKVTKPQYVFGIDIDDNVKKKWMLINLLKAFKSKAKLEVHFFHQDGLLPLPKKSLRYKSGGLDQFDLVVGNPPYGGVGLKEMTPELEKALLDFEIWRKAKSPDGKFQEELFSELQIEKLGEKRKERLEKFPIEILFIDRFIQLTKPGGHIALVIPDGILSNSNLHYVREFIDRKAKVNAIVSLPRETFKSVGTSAKTSLLFMTKPGELESLKEIYSYYKEVAKMNSEKKDLVRVIRDIHDNEIAMVRVDKTLNDLMLSCESKRLRWSRWDVKFYDEKYLKILEEISQKFPLVSFGKDISFFKQGDIPRVAKGEKGKGIKVNPDNCLLEGTSMHDTGLDYSQFQPVSDKFWQRMQGAKIHENDFIFTRTGASLGQSVVIPREPEKTFLINGALDIIRFGRLNPYYACVFMMSTKYGRSQCDRIENGVGQPNLNEDELCLFMIPDIPEAIQRNIEVEYRKTSALHYSAMEAKANGDEKGYKKHIEAAKKSLKELVTRTEAIIRGEREDVI